MPSPGTQSTISPSYRPVRAPGIKGAVSKRNVDCDANEIHAMGSVGNGVMKRMQRDLSAPSEADIIQFRSFYEAFGQKDEAIWLQMERTLDYFGTACNLESVIAWAQIYLMWSSVIKTKKHNAVVLDIDDTLLTRTSSEGRPYQSVVLDPVKHFIDYVVSLGVVVYFVTARPSTPSNIQFTIQELHKLGVTEDKYEALFLMPWQSETSPSIQEVSTFKCAARRFVLEQEDRHILLTMGDQWSDVMCIPAPPEIGVHYTNQHKQELQVAHFLQSLPDNHHYILKIPHEVAMMVIKLAVKPMVYS
jgi:hypothetical protein